MLFNLFVEYPIQIMYEVKQMLKSKVKAAIAFKEEFYNLLKNQYQNTFTKKMVADLKAIVNKGD